MSEEMKKPVMPLRKILSWYWPILRPYRWRFFGALTAYFFSVISGSVIPPLIYKRIIDIISSSDPFTSNSVWVWIGALGATFFFTFVVFRIGDYLYLFSQSQMLRDAVCFTFDRLQYPSYRFFAERFAGSLVSQARRYVDALSSLQDIFTYTIWTSSVTLIGSFFGIAFFSIPLAFVFLGGVLIIFFATAPFLRERRSFDVREATEDSRVTGRLADVIGNILAVKMFSAGIRERKSFRDFADRQEHARARASKALIKVIMVQNSLILLFQFVGISVALWLWTRGEITVGTIVLVQTYLVGIFSTMNHLNRSISEILRASARASEMIEVFETPIGIVDPEHPEEDRIREGRIEFRNVSFGYQGEDEEKEQDKEERREDAEKEVSLKKKQEKGGAVFRNFSLKIARGEKIGLVGPSGAGKSTVTKLLLRFVDPQKGEVFLDDQDIRNLRQDDFRRHIAYVPQEPLLFHRSIRENIAYGKPDATEEEIIAAAKKAEAHEFVAKLPAGYETLVGERGVKLSGGERQRVAIARALLKDAEILVLDEATSSLDSESEHAIQEALEELMKNRTAVVIAHRLSTIKKLDRIIVLDRGGVIVEEGKHDDLVARGGLYAHLWNRQTGGFIDEDTPEA